MKSRLIITAIIAIAIKVILLFAVNKDLSMTQDEKGNYEIALNHQNGNGYTFYYLKTRSFVPTAFHGSFPVFIYEFFIKNKIVIGVWVIFIYILSIVLFAISIPYFYRLSYIYIGNEAFAMYSTITYCFYPSVLFYVGALFFYENIVTPLLVIVIYRLVSASKEGFRKTDYVIIPLAICISCLLRSQAIAIYAVIFTTYIFIILVRKSYKLIPLLILTVFFTFALHVPMLIKNKKMFGEYILSTQSGFELLQGHNPYARGSWTGNWADSGSEIYKYVYSQIPNNDYLNEWDQSKARKRVAVNWIKENPLKEIKLSIRKLTIYFLPKNLEILRYSDLPNPINLLTHLFFISMVLLKVYSRKVKLDELLLFSPIAGSIILTIVFFVGYRWRYFAEPFMIIFAWMFVFSALDRFVKDKRNASNLTSSAPI